MIEGSVCRRTDTGPGLRLKFRRRRPLLVGPRPCGVPAGSVSKIPSPKELLCAYPTR